MPSTKPVIFISYSHKDGQWLEFVQGHLQVAVTNDHFETWDDRRIQGGADWAAEIDAALWKCAAFILLVSRHSLVSSFILKKEVQAALDAHWSRGVKIYPIIVRACDIRAVPWLMKMNIRPQDARALALYPPAKREDVMASLAAEIREIVKSASPNAAARSQVKLDYRRLPETDYVRLVGRDSELKILDAAWEDEKINILSLVADGGAGKSALVNEWLKRLQADSYRGAEAVLGWSFYDQGTKQRATSAEEFLNWALDKLGITLATTNSTTKAEAIAEAMEKRRVLLLLDGVEPLQHGPGPQAGQLKDQGLRALLRRFAAAPPREGHGLIVLSSRLAVHDIGTRSDGPAPVVNVEELSAEAGAALLRDNGVKGIDEQLRAAARDFGGHPLALGLLASFLKETRKGDIRQRDHIRAFLADKENPRHDHARRVMESYEKEWLAAQPALHAIMHIFGLFDRPASGDCLKALRAKPAIIGLTDEIVELDEGAWQRAVARLREVRLLAPPDPAAPDALDAHPLVREWFGERLKATNHAAWKAAHGRLYEHLRDTTKEGKAPTLEDLAPLYQAIAHGCRAGRHQEVLSKIYIDRICRRLRGRSAEYYARSKLGAFGSDLAGISWFFTEPFAMPVDTLAPEAWAWVLSDAATLLRAQRRFAEALPAMRAALQTREKAEDWPNAARSAVNLADTEVLLGEVKCAVATAEQAVAYADRSGDEFCMMAFRTAYADALHAAGKRDEAERLFADAEHRQRKHDPEYPLLSSLQGSKYHELLLAKGAFSIVRQLASEMSEFPKYRGALLDDALHALTFGRAVLGEILASGIRQHSSAVDQAVRSVRFRLDEAVDGFRTAGTSHYIPRGLLARATLHRSVGDWGDAGRDLDEVLEIAEPGPMRLFLCDMALEQARLAFAQIEAFAPLNGLIDNSPPKPERPTEAERKSFHAEAAKQLAIAADYVDKCGYHKRDEELAELQAVLRGERTFASLPPRV